MLRQSYLLLAWHFLPGFFWAALSLATSLPGQAESLSVALASPPASLATSTQPRLTLSEAVATLEVWPTITLLSDPDKKLTIDDVLATPLNAHFKPPRSAYATLGFRDDVVWLRASITLTPQAADGWILDIDYSLLNRVDVYVAQNGKVMRRAVLGNTQPFVQRPVASRSHAVALKFKPGESYDIFLRVDTSGAMILPITLSNFSAFHSRAINEQMLQGILSSLALFLLLYSLLQWRSLREPLYLKYCLLVFFSALFSIHFFGIGAQYLWVNSVWMERHTAGITALLASASTALFIEDVLGSDMGQLLRSTIKITATILIAAALLHGLGFIDIQVVSLIMGTLGLTPSLMAIPGAIRRLRRGDSVGAYFLLAWLGYFVASAIMVGVVKGYIGANAWTMHSFVIGSTFDMLIFMRIAVLRTNAIHLAAQSATMERDALHSLAHTDPLTGLMNRRGLNATLTAALPCSVPGKMLAVYMLDMDNFKPVNDQHGHDVGDELLMVVAARLRATMRVGDVVARTGGDEFVVVASGLQNESQAADLGDKLLDIFSTPFALAHQICHVGITIGYALAPNDGNDAASLLKRADAAMYSGKQNGKNRVGRGVITIPPH